MTRGLLFIIIILTSCRSINLPTEVLSTEENKLFCNGTKNMIDHIKQSRLIKNRYVHFLHNKGQIGVRIDDEVFKGSPYGLISNFNVDTLGLEPIKKLNYDCLNSSDSIPDFDVTFYFLPKEKILSAVIITILDKPGFRSGYQFETQLNENGGLGEVHSALIQE